MSFVWSTYCSHIFKYFQRGHQKLWRAGEKAITESMPMQMAMPADFHAQHSHLPTFLCMATVEHCGKFISNWCVGVFPLRGCWISFLALIIFPEILYTHWQWTRSPFLVWWWQLDHLPLSLLATAPSLLSVQDRHHWFTLEACLQPEALRLQSSEPLETPAWH